MSLLIKTKYNLIKHLKLFFKNKCCSKSEFETLNFIDYLYQINKGEINYKNQFLRSNLNQLS